MELDKHYSALCGHITALTGAHCTILNVQAKDFAEPPFRSECAWENGTCKAIYTHLFGTYEAQRWGQQYIYFCPRGLVFCAVLPNTSTPLVEYSMIIGPMVMTSNSEDLFEDLLPPLAFHQDLPHMTTTQMHSLCELAVAAVSYFATPSQPEPPSHSPTALAKMLYDCSVDSAVKDYPIQSEHLLQEYIRTGQKEAAQKLLNELLAQIYTSADYDLDRIKPHFRELLVLMNRAAIDGGADADEIFGLCRRYEQEINRLQGMEEMNRWFGMILHQFIGLVFDFDIIKHQNVIFKTTLYIKEHLSERISLEQASSQVFLSKSYFCRVIKKELGCTFTEYVNRLRIERSKQLLHKFDISISEIAFQVGFEDQSYFTRVFKRNTGISPGKYRAQCFQDGT